jgi:hypothetical protein
MLVLDLTRKQVDSRVRHADPIDDPTSSNRRRFADRVDHVPLAFVPQQHIADPLTDARPNTTLPPIAGITTSVKPKSFSFTSHCSKQKSSMSPPSSQQ